MALPAKIRAALGGCFGVGTRGRRISKDDRPEKEADQARSAADGIKAHRSTGCGMQTQRAHLVAICTQTVQMAAKDSGVQTEPLSMAEHGAQAVQDTAECGVQANDELALRMAADLSVATSRSEELAARLADSEAARRELGAALAEATTARQQLEQELARARQQEAAAPAHAAPAQEVAPPTPSSAVSTIVFSDDSGVQGGKVPALGHLDMVDQGVAALTAAELAPHMEEEALARGKAAWAAGDAVTAPQANAALIRAVEELDAAGATHAGALRHDAVAPAFTERLGAGAYGTAYQGALDGVQAVLKEYLVDANGSTLAGLWQRFTHGREVATLARLEQAGRPHTFVRPLIDDAGRGTGLIMALFPLGTLDRWLRMASPSVPALLHCCLTAAEDLEVVHAAGVAHLDIRPDNIGLRVPEGEEGGLPTAQLIDFGLAVVEPIATCPAIALMAPADTRLHDAGWVAPEMHAVQRMHALRRGLDGGLVPWTRWVGQPADVFALGRCIARVLAHPVLAQAPSGGVAAAARGTLERAVAATARSVQDRVNARVLASMLRGALKRYQTRSARGEE